MNRLTLMFCMSIALVGMMFTTNAIAMEEAHQCSGVFGKQADKTYTFPSTGDIVGITIVVEFSDLERDEWPIDMANIENLLNQEGYSGNGNNGSVRDYFADVSCGALNYTNTLYPDVFLAPETYQHYIGSVGGVADGLATAAIEWLDERGFDFSDYDANGDGKIDAINLFTQGYHVPQSALHPHFSQGINVMVDGLSADYFQLTNLNVDTSIGTFCHENGHMLCGWMDLYEGGHWGNIGRYCLMGLGSYLSRYNPIHPSGYLKVLAGWSTPTMLDDAQMIRAEHAVCDVAMLSHPDQSREEYYVIENRQNVGRDEALNESGLAIFHVRKTGPNDHYIELVPADGDDSLSDADNLWAAPDHEFFDFASASTPSWFDGLPCEFFFSDISFPGTSMSYQLDNYHMLPVAITSVPANVEAPWVITGPNGYEMSGVGEYDTHLPAIGVYTVSYGEVEYWGQPKPASVTIDLTMGIGETSVFSTNYTSPVATYDKGDLGDDFGATTVCIVDYNSDGQDDIFVGNRDGKNLVLLSDGRGGFGRNSAPPILSMAPGVIHAAWGDMDNDGDQDVFLVKEDESHMLLERLPDGGFGGTPGGMENVISNSPDLLNMGVVSSVAWSDVDRDGNLDLFVIHHDSPNKLFMGDGNGGFVLGDAQFATHGSEHRYSAWGDFHTDGYSGLFITSDTTCRIVENNGGTLVPPFGFMIEPSVCAQWADLDNNNSLDLIMISDDGRVELWLQNSDGTFNVTTEFISDLYDRTVTGLTLVDFENDAMPDAYITVSDGSDIILMNVNPFAAKDQLGLTFEVITLDHLPATSGAGVASAAVDVNADGAMDVMVVCDGSPNYIVMNKFPGRGNWFEASLESVSQNASAVGAHVIVYADGESYTKEVAGSGGAGQHTSTVHFGLLDAGQVDLIIVNWGGTSDPTYLFGAEINQVLHISESGLKDNIENQIQQTTEMGGASPNPFNPSTNIAFSLAKESNVRAEIYGVDGRRITVLKNGIMSGGQHSLQWNGRNDSGGRVSSGCYFCRIQTDNKVMSTRLTLIK